MIWNNIIQYIFYTFGVPEKRGTFSILSNKFLLKKQMIVELDDGESQEKKIWAVAGKVADSTVKLLVSDLSINAESTEYVMIIQLDELSIYALKLDLTNETQNKVFFCHDDESWVELSNIPLIKLFLGVEQLSELFIEYQLLDNYQELYKYLISFLNYETVTQNNNKT